MRDFLVKLFRDDTFGPVIDIFNIWHIIVMLVMIGFTIFMIYMFKNKDAKVKNRILDIYSISIIVLYFLDFFIHPFMEDNNYLIVDKLPFHLCTSAGILIAITRLFREKTKKWYHAPAILGLIGSIMYLTVPTGVAGDKLFCYRTIQTLMYHGALFTYGILAMAYSDIKPSFKTIYVEAVIIAIQIVISLFANAAYSIPDGRSDAHGYNWYFTKGGIFGLPISDVAMPFIIFAVFMIMACMIYGMYYLVIYLNNKLKDKKTIENN